MRIRTIKPEFWRSADVAALSIEDRLLFIGLWSYVDDYGVGRDEPQLIQCDLFPLDPLTEGSVRVHDGLTRIARRGLIIRYEGPDGRKYFQVVNWAKHQKINRKSKPVFPQYDAENCTLTESSLSPHDALTEGSLPEQGTGNREQGTPPSDPPPRAPTTTTSRRRDPPPRPLTRTRPTPGRPRKRRALLGRPGGRGSPRTGSPARPSWPGPGSTPPPRPPTPRSRDSRTTGAPSPDPGAGRPTGRPRGATGRAGPRKTTTPANAGHPHPVRGAGAPPTTASPPGSPSRTPSPGPRAPGPRRRRRCSPSREARHDPRRGRARPRARGRVRQPPGRPGRRPRMGAGPRPRDHRRRRPGRRRRPLPGLPGLGHARRRQPPVPGPAR
nr:MAG TPA: replisome organizer [Caudoviricetes sp.]